MAYVQPRDPTDVIGRRISAYLIDLALVSGAGVAIFAATKSHTYTGAPSDACRQLRDAGFNDPCVQLGSRVYTWTGGRFALAFLLLAGVGFANHVLLQGATGASIGKLMLGLRVVNAPGQVCGFGRAFVRWLLLIVDQFFCFLVGLITVLVTHPHRRVGDMVAGTYVVSTADVGRPVVPQAGMPPAYAYAGQPGWAPPPPGAPAWGAPQPQPPPPPAWGTQPPPPPAWGAPPQPSWGTEPPPYQQPQAAPPPPPPTPADWRPPPPTAPATSPPPTAPPAEPESGGESWWDKAVDDEDKPDPQ